MPPSVPVVVVTGATVVVVDASVVVVTGAGQLQYIGRAIVHSPCIFRYETSIR